MFESVALHGRFPFAVLGAKLVLDDSARSDGNRGPKSKFEQANNKLRLYSDRKNYNELSEKFEMIGIGVYKVSDGTATLQMYKTDKNQIKIT